MGDPATWVIDSGMYFAAADKCHLLAGGICLALGPLHSTLVHECGGMAGDHEKSAAWTTAYDHYAADIVTLAATLANALQRFGDVLAANGYNWWHSNRAKASGPEPDRPIASEPLYDSGMALPTTAKGDNGPGLDEGAISGLLERVGKIPNGDVTKLGKAKVAWQAFADHTTITGAADRIKGINAAFTGSTDPNITEIETKLTTLTQAAEMLAQAAKAMATPVAEHRDALQEMRDKIQADIAAAENELIAAIVITAGIVAITAALSAGLAAPAAAGGGTAITVEIVAGAATIIKNTVTVSRLLVIFGSVVAAGTASGAFTAIPDLTTNGINTALASIAALSVHIATDGEEGPSGGPDQSRAGGDPAELGRAVGEAAAQIPKGSGQGQHIATEVTKLGLGQQEAATAAESAAERAFGETAGVASLPNGNLVVLPTQPQVKAWIEVTPDGEVIFKRGTIGGPGSDLDVTTTGPR